MCMCVCVRLCVFNYFSLRNDNTIETERVRNNRNETQREVEVCCVLYPTKNSWAFSLPLNMFYSFTHLSHGNPDLPPSVWSGNDRKKKKSENRKGLLPPKILF